MRPSGILLNGIWIEFCIFMVTVPVLPADPYVARDSFAALPLFSPSHVAVIFSPVTWLWRRSFTS
jgi:hypothetical protein